MHQVATLELLTEGVDVELRNVDVKQYPVVMLRLVLPG